MTGTTAVFAALAAGGCALALWAYALFRQERAAQRGEALSDRTLYEVGRKAAARRDARGARSKESGDWEGPSMRVRALAVAGGVLAAFVHVERKRAGRDVRRDRSGGGASRVAGPRAKKTSRTA